MADNADFFQAATGGSPLCSLAALPKAAGRISIVLTLAAGLAGCNASQGVDLSSQSAPINTAGRFASSYNPYNPIKYAQTSGFYAGR